MPLHTPDQLSAVLTSADAQERSCADPDRLSPALVNNNSEKTAAQVIATSATGNQKIAFAVPENWPFGVLKDDVPKAAVALKSFSGAFGTRDALRQVIGQIK